MYTKAKAIISGSVVEIFNYSTPQIYGHAGKKIKKIKKPHQNDLFANIEAIDFSRQVSTYRAKSTIKRLIYANAYRYIKRDQTPFLPIFGTFTFADNVQDPKTANYEFTKFIKRLNYVVGQNKEALLKYLNILEFQKRGAVHYHTLFFNLDYIPKISQLFSQTWGNGFIKIESVMKTEHLSNYVTKYLSKSQRDERLDGLKAYSASRGLYKPYVFRNQVVVDMLINQLQKCSGESSTYFQQFVDYTGQSVDYSRYVFDNHISATSQLKKPSNSVLQQDWIKMFIALDITKQ